MKKLKYSLLCEDEATKVTISALVERIVSDRAIHEFDHSYFNQYRCSNKKDVLKSLPQASAYIVLPRYNLDLLLAGIDYDDRRRQDFEKELQILYEKVNHVAKQKTVLFFPVQAIEHWLYFLQYKIENPSSSKNISDEIEGLDRKNLKDKIYSPGTNKTEIIRQIVSNGDIEWLLTRSYSFNKFHRQFSDFLTKFSS